MTAITQPEIDQQVFELYDEYCHGRIDRREFLKRAAAMGGVALIAAQGLLPNYAKAAGAGWADAAWRVSGQ